MNQTVKAGIAALGFLSFLVSFAWSALVLGSIDMVSGGTWLRTGDLQLIAYWFALALGPQTLVASLVAIAPLSRTIKTAFGGGFLLGMVATLIARML